MRYGAWMTARREVTSKPHSHLGGVASDLAGKDHFDNAIFIVAVIEIYNNLSTDKGSLLKQVFNL